MSKGDDYMTIYECVIRRNRNVEYCVSLKDNFQIQPNQICLLILMYLAYLTHIVLKIKKVFFNF